VFNNYGPKPNEELLLSYGFVIPSNPDDVVMLRLPASKLREKGLKDERWLMKRDGEIEKGLLDTMRVLLGGSITEAEEDEDEDEADEHAMHEKEQKGLNLELDVLGALGQMLEDKLRKLQESGKDIQGDVRENVKGMCEVYRQGKFTASFTRCVTSEADG
jgi:hypothetical protein